MTHQDSALSQYGYLRKLVIVAGLLIVLLAITRFLLTKKTPTSDIAQSTKSVDDLIALDLSKAAPAVRKELTNFMQQVRETPDDAEAWGDLGIGLLAHRLNEPAVKCFRIAAEKQPEDYQWPYLIGHSLMFMDWSLSAVAFERAATLKPDYVPAQMLTLEVLMKSGRLKEARSRVSDGLPKAVADHPWAKWQRSRLAFLMGDYVTSRSLVDQLYSEGHVSRELLRHLMKVRRRVDPKANLIHIKRELAECPVEELTWDCPILRYVNSKKVDNEAAVMTARELLQKGNARAALGIFRVVLKSDPESPEVLFQLGQALHQLGDLKRADAVLLQAQQFEPDSFRMAILRTRIAVKRQQWDAAGQLIEKAMSLKPDSADAYYLLAVICRAQGDIEAARKAIDNSVRLDPRNTEAKRLQTQLNAG